MKLPGNSIDALVAGAVSVATNALVSKEEKARAFELAFTQILQDATAAQLTVNAVEAANTNLFVAGWRPAVGWTCVLAFFLTFVAMPVITACVVYYSAFTGENIDLSAMPRFDMSEVMPVLLGMLGMGGLRTIEKIKGTR